MNSYHDAMLPPRRTLTDAEQDRVSDRAGALWDELPGVQAKTRRDWFTKYAIDRVSRNMPVLLVGDGRTIPATRMLSRIEV